MFVKLTRLLVGGPPHDDESLMGYIVRLTEWNKYDRVSWVFSRLGLSPNSAVNGCPFVFNRSTDLSCLAKLADVSVSKLTPLLYPPVAPLRGHRQLIFNLPVPRYTLRLRRPKLCPSCLRESNYHRRIWDLAPVTACPVHKCLLVDVCPQCASAIRWNRNTLSVCDCGYDWRTAPIRKVGERSLSLTRQIYHLCGYGVSGHRNGSKPSSNPLLSLTLEDLLSAVIFLSGQYHGIISTGGTRLLPPRKNEELHELLTLGFSVFEDWPRGYYRFLDWKLDQKQGDASKTGVAGDFGNFHRALRTALTSESFDFMRTAYGEYLNSGWNRGSLRNKTLSMIAVGHREKRLLTRNEVVQLVGLTEDWIDRLLKEDKLKPTILSRPKVKLTLFERTEVENAKRYVEELLPVKEVASLLKIGRIKVVDLVKEGCLTPAHGPGADGFKFWMFEPSEIDSLNKRIEERIIKPSSETRVFIGLRTAIHIASYGKVGIGSFIKAILNGEVHPCGKSDKQGLDRFLFSREHVDEYLRRLRQDFIGNAISLEEAAKLIGVKKEQVYTFIKQGLLTAHKSFNGRNQTWLTTCENVALFKSTYLIAAHLLKELGTSSELLVSALKRNDIQPVLGQKVGKGTQYVFRKSDLKDLDLLEVVVAARNDRDPRGQKYKVISGEQAAAMLGVSVAVIRELVDGGELKPLLHPPARAGSEPNLFYREDVLKIKGARMDNPKRVTLTEAAEMLGQACDVFMRQWVRTKRISPLGATEASGKHYFLREDVEALAKLKKKIMPSREAAAVLGVNETTLYKWMLSGRVKAFSGPHIDGYGYIMYMRSDIEKLRRLLRKKAELIPSSEAARQLGVTRGTIHDWTITGNLKPVSGPSVDGSRINLYPLKEIEDLLTRRQSSPS